MGDCANAGGDIGRIYINTVGAGAADGGRSDVGAGDYDVGGVVLADSGSDGAGRDGVLLGGERDVVCEKAGAGGAVVCVDRGGSGRCDMCELPEIPVVRGETVL